MAEKSPEQQLEDARRVQEFLNDPAIKDVWVRLEKQFYREFKDATTPEKREAAWAKTNVLETLFNAVTGIVGNGQMAQHTIDARERDAKLRQQRDRSRSR